MDSEDAVQPGYLPRLIRVFTDPINHKDFSLGFLACYVMIRHIMPQDIAL